MKISLIPSVDYIKEEELMDKVVVVIDVLRATTVITTALSNGSVEVIPALEIEDAIKLKKNLELLGGERKGLKIEGFDLSNSPLEYTRERIGGKTIIMTTTNGTRAIHKSLSADLIIIGSVVNGRAAAERAVKENKDIVIVCAGTHGKFSLDDYICAGKIIYHAYETENCVLEDLAATAYMAYRDNRNNLISYASMASHYKYLKSIGREDDLNYCFTEDIIDIVPEYVEGRIRVVTS